MVQESEVTGENCRLVSLGQVAESDILGRNLGTVLEPEVLTELHGERCTVVHCGNSTGYSSWYDGPLAHFTEDFLRPDRVRRDYRVVNLAYGVEFPDGARLVWTEEADWLSLPPSESVGGSTVVELELRIDGDVGAFMSIVEDCDAGISETLGVDKSRHTS